jgi:hypothetical protein
VGEIRTLLATVSESVRGIRRHRYPLICLEEFVEAMSFAYYLEHQRLITPAQMQEALGADVDVALTPSDYVMGLFDLTGEMMRFATAVTALSGTMPSSGGDPGPRTILADLEDVASMLEMVPPLNGTGKTWQKKTDVMVEQVKKVERVGYGVVVRGNERPKGWLPDMNEAEGRADDDNV